MLKVHFIVQQFIHCQPNYLSTIHISGLVHIDTSDPTRNLDTSDPTRNRANLVCHATLTLATHHSVTIFHAYACVSVSTCT